MTYAARHADEYAIDPSDPCDRMDIDEVREVLAAMPLDPEALGDSSESDWTLSILFLLAGKGDADAHAWVAPRVAAAALAMLTDLGYPGDAFTGA